MAMEIVNFVVEIGKCFWDPVKRHVGYMVHYKSNLESLNGRVEEFEALRQDNRALVDAATRDGLDIKAEVQTWMNGADKVMEKAERLNDEAEENRKCFCRWCPDLRSCYQISKQAVKAAESICQLQSRGHFENVALPIRKPIELESTMSIDDFKSFESTKRAMDKAMEALRDDRVKIVGVYGMGGVGKTTLVKQVGVYVHRDGLFDHVVMAVVSQTPNIRRIQGQLADMLAFKLDEESESGRAGRLKERIIRGGKILIILDDLWRRTELSEIGIPSGSELVGCKSKIILTTRVENVCFAMGSQAKVLLNVLSEDDSWVMFKSKAGHIVDSPGINIVARKVAKECGGLPIALTLVARALGDKELEEWEQAARQLQMSRPANFDEEGGVFRCIKLSYDYLKGNDAKQCFLICCLFPEDSDISIEDLVKYGIGKGLFQDASTIEEARGRVWSVAKYLKASSLLLESEQEGCVKMHDVVRDTAIEIASSSNEHSVLIQAAVALKEWPRRETYEHFTAISLMSNEIRNLPEGLMCPKLQTLLVQNNSEIQEIPENFFTELKSLRVLDLSKVDISSLPSSLGLLTGLHTLCLDGCQSIFDISILGNLRKLEILSLRESCIEELPKEIEQLINLRMLDVTLSNNIKSIPPKVISSLSCLEELYMQCSFADWGQEVEGTELGTNANFDELTGLPRLKILKVDISDDECLPKNVAFDPNYVKFDICLSKNPFNRFMNVHVSKFMTLHSRSLLLDTTIKTLPGWYNKAVTQRAEKLIYVECRGLHNILEEYAQGRLNGMKSLIIQQCYGIVYLMSSTNWASDKAVFESLEELRVYNMDYLKQLCVGQLPPGSLGKLKFLEVQQCNDLVDVLLSKNLLQRLQNLEVLGVSMNSIADVFRSEGLAEEEVVLQKLREMKLDNLHQLTRIWNGPIPAATFQCLKILTMIKCKKLRYLFTLSLSQCLLHMGAIRAGWTG